ncbi:MAG: hypothetical protein KAT77_00615 [Nanoarchaeota archaeon]|nr:hypothetical protein [Nanoarchaeota archaeon]
MTGYDRPEHDIPKDQTIRYYPSLGKLGLGKRGFKKAVRENIERFVNDYTNFLAKLNTPIDVVDEVLRQAQFKTNGSFQKGFRLFQHPDSKNDNGKSNNYFVTEDDGLSFALVKYGQGKKPYVLEQGLRIIFAHTDSPCLMVKTRPELFEWDPELKELFTGARLDTLPYGGVNVYQWLGKSVYVSGWEANRNLKIKRIEFGKRGEEKLYGVQGFVPDISGQHLSAYVRDPSSSLGESFNPETLDIILGNESKKAMREYFSFKSDEDWATARIFAVPNTVPHIMDNTFVTGYGHDDRCCVYAAMRALFRSKSPFTTLVFFLDKEEVGSHGNSGAQGQFFERVISDLAEGEPKEYWTTESLSKRIKKIMRNSIAVNADVDIGSTHAEQSHVDRENVARLGYGPFVKAQDGVFDDNQISPRHVRFMRNLAERPFSRSPVVIPAQFVGLSQKADEAGGASSQCIYFNNKGLPTIDAGVGVGGLHSPEELLHGGDLFWLTEYLKGVLEKDVRL